MNFKEIKELIELLNDSSLAEFKMKKGDLELSIRTEKYSKEKSKTIVSSPPPVVPMHASPAPTPPAPAEQSAPESKPEAAPKPAQEGGEDDASGYLEIRSPIVGTFYRSASPDKPPYVKVGDAVEQGAVVCIVEAMKLFNEIESEVSGKIVKVVVEDASPVEYDQVLFLVDPAG